MECQKEKGIIKKLKWIAKNKKRIIVNNRYGDIQTGSVNFGIF